MGAAYNICWQATSSAEALRDEIFLLSQMRSQLAFEALHERETAVEARWILESVAQAESRCLSRAQHASTEVAADRDRLLRELRELTQMSRWQRPLIAFEDEP